MSIDPDLLHFYISIEIKSFVYKSEEERKQEKIDDYWKLLEFKKRSNSGKKLKKGRWDYEWKIPCNFWILMYMGFFFFIRILCFIVWSILNVTTNIFTLLMYNKILLSNLVKCLLSLRPARYNELLLRSFEVCADWCCQIRT